MYGLKDYVHRNLAVVKSLFKNHIRIDFRQI